MKKCPTCNRTYTDETLAFCLEDGAVLINIDDSAPTMFIPSPPPTNQRPANFVSSHEVSQPKSKLWIILSIIGLLAIFIGLGAIGLIAVFKDEIFGNTPRSIFTPVNTNTSNVNTISIAKPSPTPPITASQLVGRWETDVVENKIPMNITVNFKPDGNYDCIFKDKQGRKYNDYGTWQFSNDTLFQTFSNGASGKGTIKVIDKDTFEITIIDNGVPAYNGLKRKYTRVK